MREIKFRAWHKFSEEIILVFSIDFENRIINSQGPWRFFSEVELMQYTGLKDKNGVEIYEGDIVEVKTFGFDSEAFTTDILFENAQFKFRKNRSLFYFGQKDPSVLDDAEVIGNIYEHPHLLEEK